MNNSADVLTITIPTTGRPSRLADCLQSIDGRFTFVNIGARDPADLPGYIECHPLAPWVYFSNDFPVVMQTILAGISAPLSHILPISDDIEFDPGAIGRAVRALKQAFPDGDGVIGLNVRNMPEKEKCPYAYMLIGNKFFEERLGRILFHHEYQHFYADVELGEFASRLGRFRSCPEAGLVHFHPATGAPADLTHLNGRSEKWQHDHGIYEKRKRELSLQMGMR